MDVFNLRNEINKLRTDASSRRTQAGKFLQRAAHYTKDGDIAKTQVEQQQAAKLEDDARTFEEKARALELEVDSKEKQVQQLDDQKAQLLRQVNDIDKRRESLQGGSVGSFI